MNRIVVLLTSGAMLLALAGGIALAGAVQQCTGGPCDGTKKEDTINGSTNNDTIRAKRGGDTVTSDQGGQDTVLGGKGNDTIDVQEIATKTGAAPSLVVTDDAVDCGGGRDDTVFLGPDDTAQNCEDTNPTSNGD